MKVPEEKSGARTLVLSAAGLLFLLWIVLHFGILTSTQNGTLRFFLTVMLSLLVLLRPSGLSLPAPSVSWKKILFAAAAGMILAIAGLILPLRQFEWIGLLILLGVCLRWALPDRYAGNLVPALFLLYWAHPLPSRLFAALQFSMQKLSVLGSELFLHALNVRVWADGFVLRTGTNTYEVPEWCSGMRTATTMLILTFGLGLWRKLKGKDYFILLPAALGQALILNILRLSTMVLFAPWVRGGQGIHFLHDTTGIIVLAGVALVALEITLWQKYRRNREAHRNEPTADQLVIHGEYPPPWRAILHHPVFVVVFPILLAGIAVLVFKGRHSHRMAMLKGVTEALRDAGDPANALRAAELVKQYQPDDEAWEMVRMRLLLLCRKHEEVLDAAARFALEEISDDRKVETDVLRAHALMRLGRIDEAVQIAANLPQEMREKNPRTAMILAELALYADDVQGVAEHIVRAARWQPNQDRIRALYPYLRNHRQWQAIMDSDRNLPYRDLVQALSAAEAAMNLNQAIRVGEITRQLAGMAPEDPRVLIPLFFLAIRHQGGEWETAFSDHFLRTLRAEEDPERLPELFEKCFQLVRPDLAWLLYRRMEQLDPSHPSLALTAARYGDVWFSFRKRYLGVPAQDPGETLSLRNYFLWGRSQERWQRLCAMVPLGPELAGADALRQREILLTRALEEFHRRRAENRLPLSLQYQYALALEMNSEMEAARQQLLEISADDEGQDKNTTEMLSELYEQKGDWQNVYETLRTVVMEEDPGLTVLLRLCRSQIELRLGLAALYTARQAVRQFPSSTLALSLLAAALAEFDSQEEALLAMARPRLRRDRALDLLEVRALDATQRFAEAETFSRSVLLPSRPVSRNASQSLVLPPAELAGFWHRVSVPSAAHFSRNADTLRENLPRVTSPFLRDLMSLWLECHAAGGQGPAADPERWIACGRDPVEKAIALNQLTLLLCRTEDFIHARNAAGIAVKYLPESPILWRILISLSERDPDVVAAARRLCPGDSELWLVELVELVRRADSGKEESPMEAYLVRTLSEDSFSAAALTRAGEYLFRKNHLAAATQAARSALARARGLLPAYVLGLKCALRSADRKWALECAQMAIRASVQPRADFYERLVLLKTDGAGVDTDADMVNALTTLRREDPENPLWAQILGYIRYQRGGWEIMDAMYQMDSAIAGGVTNRIPHLIFAEAARRLGHYDRAVDTLRKAVEKYPEDIRFLNNLAYTLSFLPEEIPAALALEPRLRELAPDNLNVLDTLAVVQLRAGNSEAARELCNRILARAENGTGAWFRANMHLAEVLLRGVKGEKDAERKTRARAKATELLDDILRTGRKIPEEDILAAHRLLTESKAP